LENCPSFGRKPVATRAIANARTALRAVPRELLLHTRHSIQVISGKIPLVLIRKKATNPLSIAYDEAGHNEKEHLVETKLYTI
jgi:hypothetical protein